MVNNGSADLDEKVEKNLWEELKLLQPIIDKFDGFTYGIKNWFITILVAISGYAIANKPAVLWINLFLVLAFYLFEVIYRLGHASFLKRAREIEEILRGQRKFAESDKGPHREKYLFPESEAAKGSLFVKLFKLQGKLGVPEDRAKENVKAAANLLPELRNMLFQPRVSFVYLFALVGTFLLWLIL